MNKCTLDSLIVPLGDTVSVTSPFTNTVNMSLSGVSLPSITEYHQGQCSGHSPCPFKTAAMFPSILANQGSLGTASSLVAASLRLHGVLSLPTGQGSTKSMPLVASGRNSLAAIGHYQGSISPPSLSSPLSVQVPASRSLDRPGMAKLPGRQKGTLRRAVSVPGSRRFSKFRKPYMYFATKRPRVKRLNKATQQRGPHRVLAISSPDNRDLLSPKCDPGFQQSCFSNQARARISVTSASKNYD